MRRCTRRFTCHCTCPVGTQACNFTFTGTATWNPYAKNPSCHCNGEPPSPPGPTPPPVPPGPAPPCKAKLDVVVILGEPTFPGCRIMGRILGNLDMEDDAGQDDKLLCVPDTDPRWRHLQDIDDVPVHLKAEIGHFFRVYKDLENKQVDVRGWQDRATAEAVLADARARYAG